MKMDDDLDWNFWAMLIFGGFILAIFAPDLHAKAARDRCLVRLDNRSVAAVSIGIDGTVLDFPVKPAKVILGRKNSFGIEYVESDLAISPLSTTSKSHLYVYLEGRRFTFDLSTRASGGCAVIVVRDAEDNQVTVDNFIRSGSK